MTLVETLRAFAQAYPVDVFPPITDEERERLGPGLISRASAGMVRHLSSFFTDAADRIEALENAARACNGEMGCCAYELVDSESDAEVKP